MGIRFYCPNGHKLNVKTFQAGQKGICPVCGVKMQIPLESTRPSSRQQRRNASWKPPSPSPADGPESLPAVSDSEKGARVLGERGERKRQREDGDIQIFPLPTPYSPLPASARSGKLDPSPSPQQPPSSAVPRVAADPLAEEATWYVRPATGGQFGPATSAIMRIWLAEGRIAADTLVWRDGWRDWQEAQAVFGGNGIRSNLPQQGGPRSAPVGPGALSAAESLSNARRMLLTIVVIGTLVLLGIIAVLLAFFGGHR